MDNDGSDEGEGEPEGEECAEGDASCDEINDAPVGDLSADVTEGEAPLDVVFSFNGTDVDNATLTWTLDVQGDGTPETEGTENNLPGNFTFTYTEAGQYTPEFVVSDGNANHTVMLLVTVNEPPAEGEEGEGGEEEEPPQFEDRGEYLYEFATGHCHRKEYTTYLTEGVEVLYRHDTWVFAESNSVPGLQLEDNHPVGGPFAYPGVEDCSDGDLILV